MKRIDFTLDRVAKKAKYTIGKLYDMGHYFCDTLEDPVRLLVDNNKDGDFDDLGEGKIKAQTAIPAGTYRVIMTMSNRFKKVMPLLVDVKGFEGIRMHSGNTPEDTEGCILSGKNKIVGELVDSRIWTAALYAKIEQYIADGYEVYITIK